MIRQILKMGTPSLLEVSQPILPEEFNQAELLQLIADLVDTQRHLGGVGIAAPQIGINKRVVIIEYYQAQISRYNDVGDCPLRVVINPKLTMIGDEVCAYNEGCLSLPGLRGEVIRPKVLSYEYVDQFGNYFHGEDDGFLARVMQHECDHLDGILYPMRMTDLSKLAFVEIE